MNYLETLYEPDSTDGSEFFPVFIEMCSFLFAFFLWLLSRNKLEVELGHECTNVRIDLYRRILSISPKILYVHEELGEDDLKSWLYVYLIEDEPHTFLFEGWHSGYIARIAIEARKKEGLQLTLCTEYPDFDEALYGSTPEEIDWIVAHVQKIFEDEQVKRTSVHILSLIR